MTLAGHRHERIAAEIQQEVAALLAGELKDPRIAAEVNVTEVRVSPDLKRVRIYVNIPGNPDEQAATGRGLAAAAGFVRRELVVRLRLRRAPEIAFVLDRSEEYGQRIEELLRRAKNPEPS